MTIDQVAQICHMANKSYCFIIGDRSQKPWDEAEEWQRQSAINGVVFALGNPEAPASAQHDEWMADKYTDGWAYGPVKDAVNKTHPCLVPYNELPIEQQIKDHLFRGIVSALGEFVR